MSLARIAARYAKSLIDLSKEQNKLEIVHADIVNLAAACTNKDFLLLCKSPVVPSGKKASIFRTLFEKSFDPMSFGFFNILLRKGREEYMPEVAAEFIKQFEAIKKITRVKLTTAETLDNTVLQDIKTKLTSASSTRDNIEVETKVRPDIIGGFILEYDDKLYDASVSNQLRLMSKALSAKTN
ncbi:MAG: ATP synthase F1 subunit delta [Saprospiraceae bacterium]|nr:ATP synthase F1 subunit delta [Saprospiraceae bacterium]